MSPAMEEGFLITGPPGKSQSTSFVTPTCNFRHKELAPLKYLALEEKLNKGKPVQMIQEEDPKEGLQCLASLSQGPQ